MIIANFSNNDGIHAQTLCQMIFSLYMVRGYISSLNIGVLSSMIVLLSQHDKLQLMCRYQQRHSDYAFKLAFSVEKQFSIWFKKSE